MNPPAMPCRTRTAMRLPMLQAAPAAAEVSMNRASDHIHTRLAPKRSAAQPVAGIAIAKASRYPVLTHCTVVTVVCNCRLSPSMATLTIVVSSSGARPPTTRIPAILSSAGSRRSLVRAAGMRRPLSR